MLNTILINVFALLLSFAIFAGHYNGNTRFDLAFFNKAISEYAIILIFVFIISLISLYLYDSDENYNKRWLRIFWAIHFCALGKNNFRVLPSIIPT